MPPESAPSPKLPLPAWIKLWTERGVDMRMAMAMASKLYTSHPTLPLLSTLTLNYLVNTPDLFPSIKNPDDKREKDKDKDLKRVVGNALRGLKEVAKKKGGAGGGGGGGQGGNGDDEDDGGSSHKPSPSSRKRRRTDKSSNPNVANPLIPLDLTPNAIASSSSSSSTGTGTGTRNSSAATALIPANLRFHEITDLATLRDLGPIETNRAPCMTAWSFVIAEKMGFDRMEALSLASVFTSITSTAHALSLGNIYTTPAQIRDAQQELDDLPKGPAVSPRISDRGDAVGEKRKREGGIDEDWEEDPVGGNAQPWVGIMGRRLPVIQLSNGSWRGLTKGRAVEPEKAHAYISKAFRSATPHVIGSLRLLARCFSVEELNKRGYGMYVAFRPEVRGWGDKGVLFCSSILDLIPDEAPDATTSNTDKATAKTQNKQDEDDHQQNGKEGQVNADVKPDAPAADSDSDLSDVPKIDDGQTPEHREDVFEGLDEAEWDDD